MAVCDFHGEVKEVINNHEVRIRDLEIDGATRDEKGCQSCCKNRRSYHSNKMVNCGRGLCIRKFILVCLDHTKVVNI